MKNRIIYKKWDGVEVVELHAGEYTARIIPGLGGNIVKLAFHNEDILNAPKDLTTYKNAQNNFGIPHLFPSNRIRGGRFTFRGKEHQFPVKPSGNSLHGFLHFKEWKVEDKKIGKNFVSLKVSYESGKSEGYYEYFPYEFKCIREYRLGVDGLTENYRIENLGSRSMPLSIGYHTAFPLKKNRNERVKLSIGNKLELTKDKVPTGKNLILNKNEKNMKLTFGDPSFENMDNLYTAKEFIGEKISHGAIIAGAHSKGDIIYEVDSRYKYWILCNYENRGDIICIEPQTSSIDAHNRIDGNLIALDAKNSWETTNKLYIKDEKEN